MFSSKRGRRLGDTACIFVHAGAGYHSVQNENIHLQACNDAAKSAMALLRNGGSAVDAVEIAVKILEDREITNAGYGSNLAIDGVVECDAVVVDHFGRSGAAGAVAQIKNPVSLARLLLDHTTRTLSLRRVPPNLLVGQGATDFAYEHGMPVLPLDFLVSPAARDRWRRWRDDLDRAEQNSRLEATGRIGGSAHPSDTDLTQDYDYQYDTEQLRRAHTKAMRNGVWNEAQPISPPPSDDRGSGANNISSPPSHNSSSVSMDTRRTSPEPMEEYSDPHGPPGLLNPSKNPFANSTQHIASTSSFGLYASHVSSDGGVMQGSQGQDLEDYESDSDFLPQIPLPGRPSCWHDGSSECGNSDDTTIGLHRRQSGTAPRRSSSGQSAGQEPVLAEIEAKQPAKPEQSLPRLPSSPPRTTHKPKEMPDNITDTVGAIAIDSYGNIACAASSGGIGMKHRGRIGPAALVGIGAAVIPHDADDSDHTTVATVTSGTGEHMGTTMAAGVCAERIYQCTRRVQGGFIESCGDDEALHSFIQKDFMGHPSVVNSHSAGAIGVLSVKKTKDGAYLYFAHNTDSFALASMHADENKPVCTMSRNKGNGAIAQGGRAIRYRRKK